MSWPSVAEGGGSAGCWCRAGGARGDLARGGVGGASPGAVCWEEAASALAACVSGLDG